jgi:hypothetical protein
MNFFEKHPLVFPRMASIIMQIGRFLRDIHFCCFNTQATELYPRFKDVGIFSFCIVLGFRTCDIGYNTLESC